MLPMATILPTEQTPQPHLLRTQKTTTETKTTCFLLQINCQNVVHPLLCCKFKHTRAHTVAWHRAGMHQIPAPRWQGSCVDTGPGEGEERFHGNTENIDLLLFYKMATESIFKKC